MIFKYLDPDPNFNCSNMYTQSISTLFSFDIFRLPYTVSPTLITTCVLIYFTWHPVSFQYFHPHHHPHRSSDHWGVDVPHFLLVVKYLDKNKTCHILIGKHTIRKTLVMFSGFLLFYIKKCTIYKSLEILLAAVLGFLAFCCPDLDATFSQIF